MVNLNSGLWMALRHTSIARSTSSSKGGNRLRLYFRVFFAAISVYKTPAALTAGATCCLIFWGAPMPDIVQTNAALVLTMNADAAVNLSSDKLTARLRHWPRNRGRTNNGSACRPLFWTITADRGSSIVRLSDQLHHGYELVLD